MPRPRLYKVPQTVWNAVQEHLVENGRPKRLKADAKEGGIEQDTAVSSLEIDAYDFEPLPAAEVLDVCTSDANDDEEEFHDCIEWDEDTPAEESNWTDNWKTVYSKHDSARGAVYDELLNSLRPGGVPAFHKQRREAHVAFVQQRVNDLGKTCSTCSRPLLPVATADASRTVLVVAKPAPYKLSIPIGYCESCKVCVRSAYKVCLRCGMQQIKAWTPDGDVFCAFALLVQARCQVHRH